MASPSLIRRSDERGRTQIDWLSSRHTFSFGDYQNPRFTRFHTLRVINDDVIAPGAGFGQHPHRDMEIISWVTEGALKHRDTLGNEGTLRPGDAQVMTAGSGIEHSEFNALSDASTSLIQMWIFPHEKGLPPSHQQRNFPIEGRRNRWQEIAGPQGLPIHQDARVLVADLEPGGEVAFEVPEGRNCYLHVVRGDVQAGPLELNGGDAAAWEQPAKLLLHSRAGAQILAFDLA